MICCVMIVIKMFLIVESVWKVLDSIVIDLVYRFMVSLMMK